MGSARMAAWRALTVLASVVAVVAAGCGKNVTPRGGLMLVVTEDGPLGLDRLRIDVRTAEGTPLRESDYRLPLELTLPTTLAIASSGRGGEAVQIAVAGFRAGVPIDRRDHLVEQVPTDRVAALTVVLSARCSARVVLDGDGARSTCAPSETCDPRTGGCASGRVDASGLPDYAAGDEARDAALPPVGEPDATVPDAGPAPVDAAPDVPREAAPAGCAPDEKACGAVCVKRTDPAYGCDLPTCSPCGVDPNAVYTCDKTTKQCGLASCLNGTKPCGGRCVSMADPTYGCGATTCSMAACPDAGTGTLVCMQNACVVGSCGAGTKKCGSLCVPTDRNNGCEAASCTACGASETCQGSPTACTCVADRLTPCIGKSCGGAVDNCGVSFDCPDQCERQGLVCATNQCTCVSQPIATTCAGKACGPTVDNCGKPVLCPNTCAAGTACGVGGKNSCGVPASCAATGVGLSDCTSLDSTGSCCATALVPGGTYGALNAPGYPTTVSAFNLDVFEVTLARFRRFAAAWGAGWRPADGDGKHLHLNGGLGVAHSAGGYEAGWSGTWNSAIGSFTTDLACPHGIYGTTTTANEARPVNCVTWREAFAFCIWDGGFLPTPPEWGFAATGGAEQRTYAWGNTSPTASRAVYCPAGLGACDSSTILSVGSKPQGAGRWKHLDQNGNLSEWAFGAHTKTSAPCIDCAKLTPSTTGTGFLGGSYYVPAQYITNNDDQTFNETYRSSRIGFRCARLP